MASDVVLWIVLLLQGLVILGLMREVGLIHVRLGPAAAMGTPDQGLPVGSTAPELEGVGLQGHRFRFGQGYGKAQLIVFASPSCSVCHDMLQAISIIASAERRLVDVFVICADTTTECREFLEYLDGDCRIAVDEEGSLRKALRVSGSSFAIVIDAEGRVGESGIVNNLQHLEYLLRSLSGSGQILIAREEKQAPNGSPIKESLSGRTHFVTCATSFPTPSHQLRWTVQCCRSRGWRRVAGPCSAGIRHFLLRI